LNRYSSCLTSWRSMRAPTSIIAITHIALGSMPSPPPTNGRPFCQSARSSRIFENDYISILSRLTRSYHSNLITINLKHFSTTFYINLNYNQTMIVIFLIRYRHIFFFFLRFLQKRTNLFLLRFSSQFNLNNFLSILND
jgi:hypothetical protein